MRMKSELGLGVLAALLLVHAPVESATIRGVIINGTSGGAGKVDLVRIVDVSSGEMDQS